MVAGGGVYRANERTYYIIYMYRRGLGQGEVQRAVGGVDAQAVDRLIGHGVSERERHRDVLQRVACRRREREVTQRGFVGSFRRAGRGRAGERQQVALLHRAA